MSAKIPNSLEELRSLVEKGVSERASEIKREREKNLPSEFLIWLALPPGWTVETCEQLYKWVNAPEQFRRPENLFERLIDWGMFEKHEALPLPGDTTPRPTLYVMHEEERKRTIEEFLSEKKSRYAECLSKLSKLGGMYLDAEADSVTPRMHRWATLAVKASDGKTLVDEVLRLITQAYDGDKPGEIKLWINSARDLQSAVTGIHRNTLERTVRRAGLYLELLDRDRHDQQHLSNFLKRPEQIEQVNTLITESDQLWATHFIGAGGVGKTMLVRYITSQRSKKEHWNVHTARIDFDYINPNYPRMDPGLMLWSFAQELRAYDPGTKATGLFNEADQLFQKVHEELLSGTTGEEFIGTRNPLFRRALHFYIDAIKCLEKPVLLVIDTCEELAKAGPWTTAQENVNETFRILQALHDGPDILTNPDAKPGDGVSNLRVLFAGRRPLAKGGHKWESKTSTLDERPFLRLFEIRGFDFVDAKKYLNSIHVPKHLIQPIINKSSPDAGSVADITWKDSSFAPAEKNRCNPYDLRLLIDWATEKPPPSAHEIEHVNTEQYVKLRILRRLENDVLRDILPLLALTKYCNQSLLEVVIPEKRKAGELFQVLQRQEWIERRNIGVDARRQVVYIEEGLRLRLMEYFNTRHVEYFSAVQRITDYLEQKTLNEPLAILDPIDLDMAIRVMEGHPERAYSWWTHVEERFFEERLTKDPYWIKSTIDFLAGEEGAAAIYNQDRGKRAQPESMLRPMVLMTLAGALLEMGEDAAFTGVLNELDERLAESNSTVPKEYTLRMEALAMRLKSISVDRLSRFLEVIGNRSNWDYPYTITAWISSGEHLVEQISLLSNISPKNLQRVERLSRRVLDREGFNKISTAHQSAFVLSLISRVALALGIDKLVLTAANASIRIARTVDRGFKSALPYWMSPDNLVARVHLEAARCLYPVLQSSLDTLNTLSIRDPSKFEDATSFLKNLKNLFVNPRSSTIDEDRLYAVLFKLNMSLQLPTATPNLEQSLKVHNSWFDRKNIRCTAHREVPPAFVIQAEMSASQGHIKKAISILKKALRDERIPLEIKLHIDRALTRIITRYRLDDEGESTGTYIKESLDHEDIALSGKWNGLRGNRGIVTGGGNSLVEFHANWQGQFLLGSHESTQASLKAMRQDWDRIQLRTKSTSKMSPFLSASLRADFKELSMVCERSKIKNDYSPKLDESSNLLDVASTLRDPFEQFSIQLRSLALDGLPIDISTTEEESSWDLFIDPALIQRIGIRRAAIQAFHEGELLSLRLPVQAAILFKFAFIKFKECKDSVGAALSAAALGCTIPQCNEKERYNVIISPKYMEVYSKFHAYLKNAEVQEMPPPFEDVTQFGSWSSSQFRAFLDDQPVTWRPWLLRLVGVRIWGFKDAKTRATEYAVTTLEKKSHLFSNALRYLLGLNPITWFSKEQDPLRTLFERSGWLLKLVYRFLPEQVDIAFMSENAMKRLDELQKTHKEWIELHYGAEVHEQKRALPADFTYLSETIPEGLDADSGQVEPVSKQIPEQQKPSSTQHTDSVAESPDLILGDSSKDSSGYSQPSEPPLQPDTRNTLPKSRPATRAKLIGFIITLIVALMAVYFQLSPELIFESLGKIEGLFNSELLIALVSVLLAALGILIYSMVMAWRRSYSLEIRLENASDKKRSEYRFEEKLNVDMIFHFKEPRWTYLLPFITRGSQTVVIEDLSINIYEDYYTLYEILLKRPLDNMIDQIPQKFAGLYDILLVGEPNIHGIAWESLLMAITTQTTEASRVIIRRSTRKVLPYVADHERSKKGVRVQSVVGDLIAGEMAQDVFEILEKPFLVNITNRESFFQVVQNLQFPIREVSYDVLHIVGTVQDRSDGLQIRIPNYEKSDSLAKQSSFSKPNEFYISPRALVNSTNIQVCIIQEELIDFYSERTASDRIKASMARTLAAQLFEAGIPVVIYLPALELDTSLSVLQVLAKVINKRPVNGTLALLEAIEELRRIISNIEQDKKSSLPPPSILYQGITELGFDACLFCAKNWNARKAFR